MDVNVGDDVPGLLHKQRTIMCPILNGYGIKTFWFLEEKARFTEYIWNNIIKNIR